jgi:hypothetical protein
MERIDSIISHVDKSFTNAELYISGISQEILDIHGMTGEKTRHFYNNLLNVPNARYLEIGSPEQKMWHNGICVFVLQKPIQISSEEQCA